MQTYTKIQTGISAHIGNGHEQQDDACIIKKPDLNCTIIAVADGHGSYTGKTAANACIRGLHDFTDANIELITQDVPTFLHKCYEYLHNEVRTEFVKQYARQYKDVTVDHDGRVLYRMLPSHSYVHVNGGAMLTIAVLIQGKLYVSNVGDCKAILCTPDNAEILTRDHSPDNHAEHARIKSDESNKLLFVYDDLTIKKKCYCEPIYDDEDNVREDVKFYYKSISKDRATYVTTPEEHPYADALASTRAIGNYNMNCLGVTWIPEIKVMDLNTLCDKTICIAIATDGIWDNLLDDAMRKCTMHEPCLKLVEEDDALDPMGSLAATRIAKSIVTRVAGIAQKNFPNNADNMTCALMYLTME